MNDTEERRDRFSGNVLQIVLGAAAVLSLIMIIVSAASAISRPTVNLNRFVEVTVEGYDTVGKAVVTIDEEGFAAQYDAKLEKQQNKYASVSLKDLLFPSGKSESGSTYAASLLNSVAGSYTLSADSDLSNGDEVTLTWVFDEATLEEAYGCNIKYDDITITAEGLEEAQTFDAFEGLTVTFEGIAPAGSAVVSGTPSAAEAAELYYEFDETNGSLSNGDTVTLTVYSYSGDVVDYCIENYDMIPAGTTKTFTVEGLSSYVQSTDDISDDALETLREAAKEIYNNDETAYWDEEEEILQSLNCMGYYLMTPSGEYYDSYNMIFLVYDAEIKNSYSNDDDSYSGVNTVYWYVGFYNVLVDEDGVLTADTDNYRTPWDYITVDSGVSSGWYGTHSWEYEGYETSNELYEVLCDDYEEMYEIVSMLTDSESSQTSQTGDDAAADENAVVEDDAEDGVIFPNSSEELLSESDIENLTDEELRYAINEIYARNGYIFSDSEMLEYYRQFDWYSEEVESSDFTQSMLNSVEQDNIELLQAERDSR